MSKYFDKLVQINENLDRELKDRGLVVKDGKNLAEIDGGRSDSDKGDTIGSLISAGSVNHDYFNSRGYKTTDEIERENDIRDGVGELMAALPQILTAREIVVVKGIMDGKNLAEIGKTLKLSRMRISQISREVFAKIKKSPLGGKLKSLI